jgi:hypothetical protein
MFTVFKCTILSELLLGVILHDFVGKFSDILYPLIFV